MSGPTYIFAGGGTGGHLYPGIAIWRELQALQPDAAAVFVCSSKPLDAEILAKELVEYRPIPAKPFGVRPRALWRFLSAWGPSVRRSREILRGGDGAVVVAMGGYAAAPVVQAARAERVPVVLVNLDAVPGKANMWISRHAAVRLTAADSGRVPESWERVSPIVRAGARGLLEAGVSRAKLGLHPDRPTLLVTGGSQGAGSLNAFVCGIVRSHPGVLRSGGWQVLHQTGPGENALMSACYLEMGIQAVVVPFLSDMASAWAAADFAIARCGANTVAEVWANKTPTLFLPYPFHKDQHQRFNAEPLERAGGAVVRTDWVDMDRNVNENAPVVLDLLASFERRREMRRALEGLGAADGAMLAARAISVLAANS